LPRVRIVAASDKFRGTATAAQATAAIAAAVRSLGMTCDEVPLADGGEGTLDALGGANRWTDVTGPLGDSVRAGWRWRREYSVIEMAQASGLSLVGGREGNDAVAASTEGTGELIAAALDAGSKRIIVGVGGSATTDGGLGCLRAMPGRPRLRGITIEVACDVRTRFTEAAAVFGPQKGATPAQVEFLRRRLERLVELYRDEYGVDVSDVEHGGAAGGLAGGLAAVGAELVSGFDLVADELDLAARLDGADLIITGEGFLDEQSFDGKVVGGVLHLAAQSGVPVLAIAGEVFDGAEARLPVISLARRFGLERSLSDPLGCIRDGVVEHFTSTGSHS
jgi:glycerate kinase